ncbi:lipase, hormone-sensitive a isoform X3 [Neoarius graeffei]|uniref:lipase, hormone-sensitive a isoform X3 n=1 Tax=Neoarius graeffei TaxID=443677 RepID=UPI00298C9C94|nr:lipase, hormone-sensitive a isoform X3 [Neoarius graeffei]
MDHHLVFSTLETVCEEAISAINTHFSSLQNDATSQLLATMRDIHEHGQAVKALVSGFAAVYHHFDFNTETPGNGYRTLVKVVLSCVLCIIQKGRYIASNCGGMFFRVEHNAGEMKAYCMALCQLRALLYLAQRLLNNNTHEQLHSLDDEGLSRRFISEYTSMHKACFYGRCLGFQFSPSLRPFMQTVVISMVSFGENYKKQQTRLASRWLHRLTSHIQGRAALSVFTSGKYVMDPELRGAEFERITQNLDMHFWKTFWNMTETELISDSAELLSFSRSEGSQLSRPVGLRPQTGALSSCLLIHFHGGGFVAQTSKSHESYLKSWSKDLNVPILSVDYSLAPEAPFPRALEECFFAYCWALKNCHLLGSTAKRVCLAGDSAGGNLCITVSMKAISHGVRIPDGIMAAYPATLLTIDASPSRFLTLIDPVLPLNVLSKCIDAYTGVDSVSLQLRQQMGSLSTLEQDTPLFLENITQGASNQLQSGLDHTATSPARSSDGSQNTMPHSINTLQGPTEFPEGFEPLRSGCLAEIHPPCLPIMKNPFVSPLLASDSLLRGLPPVHLVASALDALLDDSVMFAKKLKSIDQPVTLTVLEDIPHGFLSLSHLCKETKDASDICVTRIKEVFEQDAPQ